MVFRPHYANLDEYLEGFRYTVAVLQDDEALERTTFELREDCQAEGVRYVEVRFAPQLHVRPGFDVADVVRAVDRGLGGPPTRSTRGRRLRRAGSPASSPGSSCARCASSPRSSRRATGGFSRRSPRRRRASCTRRRACEVARAAARLRHERGAARRRRRPRGPGEGLPAEDHREAYQVAHEAFLGKTVHAGEDYGPESIFQAIGDLHADRIGHGTWLFDESKIDERADHRPTGLRRAAGAVHRRQADHDRGLPDVEPADGPRAGGRPAPAPVRRDAQAPALDDLLHRQPARVEHHRVERDRSARSRRSR